jgi:glycosyltransferase 2 family protein
VLKTRVADILKVLIPMGAGAFVVWYQFDKLTDEQVASILDSFRTAEYLWVALSIVLGAASHWSRAFRWRYLLQPMGIVIRPVNAFLAVLIGYVANIILPRFGEVWRCVLVSRYEKASFERLFGTVVAERIADVVVVSAIMALTVALQFPLLKDKLDELFAGRFSNDDVAAMAVKGIGLVVLALTFFYVLWRMLKKSSLPLFVKLRQIVTGLMEGMTSIARMERKYSFAAHTLFIWAMYIGMFYLPFFSLPETSSVPVGGVLAAFVMGSLSIALVQGGIGVYPLAVAETLRLYDVPFESGLALGWIIWSAQTGMLVAFGTGSMVVLPMINSQVKPNPLMDSSWSK